MPVVDEPRLRTRDAVALGLLHGPAELLPISSSGHVALVPWLLGWPYAELDDELRKAFEVALHAGTVAALLVGLRGEVAGAARALDGRGLRVLALSALPPAIAGLALERTIERRLGSPGCVAGGLVAGSVAMAVADARGRGTRRRADAGDGDGLALGLAQACALLPGVSRNGATLTAARARGFTHADASVLSRHVALPVIAGATGLKALRLLRMGLPAGARHGFAAGIGASFAATLAALPLVHAVERERSLLGFAAYRIGLAAVVLRRLWRSR
ncbi:MAG TPA: undecaprenyl-diphosphate phosphatase [Solirubrobacteraceae bacterium]|jgi:undecaprenyl-diphosphatase|nr:undecaprenyl-diphosphate phosphatase [Solirubrobacteraceae bacterium]